MKKVTFSVSKKYPLILFVIAMLSAVIPVKAQSNIVPLDTAESWRWQWVDFVGKLKSKDKAGRDAVIDSLTSLQGFFVPLEDLTEFIGSLKAPALGARFYMAYGLDSGSTIREMKLIMVGVDADGKDMVPGRKEKPTKGDRVKKEDPIYDLTSPCPNTCDLQSPLYTNNKNRRKPKK